MPASKFKKSTRLRGWDYRTTAYYFVTICTSSRRHLFENPIYHETAEVTWNQIPTWPSCSHLTLDESIIMPDHVHGLLYLDGSHLIEEESKRKRAGLQSGELGSVIGIFKRTVTRRLRNFDLENYNFDIWQHGYWDRIVRDEFELNRIRQYICQNPFRWKEKRENLDTLLKNMTYHPA